MIDPLLLLSGQDVPFPQAQVIIVTPKIKDIALIGEEQFYHGCGLLNFNKENLNLQDKTDLNNTTNFDIIMSIMMEKNDMRVKKDREALLLFFDLLFPNFKINYTPKGIVLFTEQQQGIHSITNENFEDFKNLINELFCLKSRNNQLGEYNPEGNKAKAIADKLKKGKQKVASMKGQENEHKSLLARYASIVAVGLKVDLQEVMNYSIYQLFDCFERMCLKQDQEFYIKAQMAGAKDLKEVDNWMKNIHS